MLLLLQSPSLKRCWYHQPLLFALLINLALVGLMYWLTMGNQNMSRTKPVSLSTVFQARQAENVEPEMEPLFEVSQAPQSASMPPPPMALNVTRLEFDSSVTIANIKVPLETSKPNLQMVSLTFSPQGNGLGSVMTSAMAQAKPVFQIPPQYPAKAKQNGIEGHVTLDLLVDASGRAQDIKVVEETPAGVFARSAKRAVIRWRFAAPEESQWQRITIRYELEK
ncbi:Protein TonB [Vibrio scophthalmi]|uniref:energy transducer TonB n=1 Tax=Vibrio scophthalmi TaxID=45658 RepID=UPI0008092004|nr:energy transducer TonB [Vibrio scophthalmi]ANS85881.1 Protein TonB [Vibrio scophthalmi]